MQQERKTWAQKSAEIAAQMAARLRAIGLGAAADKILVNPESARDVVLLDVLPNQNGRGGGQDEG